MKNLKKVLALVLVIASLMGMATMASATKSDDYSDADSITHVEAVDVMSTIGVFDGISGAFSGDSILTREQAAKIITYMILGKDDADALVASVAPYTDVSRDRWSAGSIAYCKNAGILAGVGNGRFEPDGKLTGVAFAKMCLVALGYDPAVQNLTGPQWAVNTSTLAIADAGIASNLSAVSLADEMSREDACQMAFNTLKADLVDYDNRGSIITAGDITINTTPSKAKPIKVDVSRVDERNNGTNIKEDEILQFGERYFTKLKKIGGADSFGRPATTWKYKSDDIGTYVDTTQLVQSWTAKAPKGEMYNAIGGSITTKLHAPDGARADYNFKFYANGGEYHTMSDTAIKENFFVKNSTAAAGYDLKSITNSENIGKSGNGVLTELYMDDEDNVTVVMINTFLVQATADYNTTTERVNVVAVDIDNTEPVPVKTSFLPTYIENDDFDVSGVKENDYLLVTVSNIDWTGTKKADLESVTPATIQTGPVTEYTHSENVTVGGTKYSYNKILGSTEKSEEFSINSDATLILDTYGYIMKVDDAVTSSSFVYIDSLAYTNSTLKNKVVADAYFTDGTNSEITIAKLAGSRDKESFVNSTNNKKWYTFSGGSNGEYTLTNPLRYDSSVAVAATGTDANKLISGSAVSFLKNASIDNTAKKSIKADDKTIFVIKDEEGDVTAYTGIANAPSVTLKANAQFKTNHTISDVTVAWICKKGNAYANYVFVDVSDVKKGDVDIDGGNTTADYMFILKATKNKTYVDGKEYLKYTVFIDGKQEERWISDTLANGSADDNGRLFYNVREDGDGYIIGGKEVGKEGSSNKTRYRALMSFDVAPSTFDQVMYYAEASKTNVYTVNDDVSYWITEDTNPTDTAVFGQPTIGKNGSSVLTIPALTGVGKSELIANNKSNLNLVLGEKACKKIGTDGDSFDARTNTNVSSIASTLDGWALAGRVYLITTDDVDSTEIDTLWIYVDDVKKKT